MTTPKTILNHIAPFSPSESEWFEKHTTIKTLAKGEVLLKEGAICQSLYYILSGSFFQYQIDEADEVIIDLHVQDEWMYNHQSLIQQSPSSTTLKAFEKAEILELTLSSYHYLVSQSTSFLQLSALLNQPQHRTHIFDNALSPAQSYAYLQKTKPLAIKTFPVKMIASFLKIAPETLSRIRAKS